MNISEATFGAVTPSKSGMPFQLRRSKGEPGAPLLNSSIRCLSSLRSARTSSWLARSQLTQPVFRSVSSCAPGPTMVNFIDPMGKD